MLQRITGPQVLPGAAVTGVQDQGWREGPFMTERLMPGHMILQCGHRYHGNRGLAPSFTPVFCLRGGVQTEHNPQYLPHCQNRKWSSAGCGLRGRKGTPMGDVSLDQLSISSYHS